MLFECLLVHGQLHEDCYDSSHGRNQPGPETYWEEGSLQKEDGCTENQSTDECDFHCLIIGDTAFLKLGRKRAGLPAKCFGQMLVLAHHIILELIHRQS